MDNIFKQNLDTMDKQTIIIHNSNITFRFDSPVNQDFIEKLFRSNPSLFERSSSDPAHQEAQTSRQSDNQQLAADEPSQNDTDLPRAPPHSETAGSSSLRQEATTQQQQQQQQPREDNPNRIECKLCGRTFGRIKDLRSHNRLHIGTHREGKNKFTCRKCPQVFSDGRFRRKHEGTHAPTEPPRPTEPTRPIESRGANGWVCGKCGRTFVHRSGLVLHARIHDGRHVPGKNHFECSECKEVYSDSRNFWRHKISHKVTNQRRQLEQVGSNSVVCKYCTRLFPNAARLNQHLALHDGRRPGKNYFKCRECEHVFGNSTYRSRHEAEAHNKVSTNVVTRESGGCSCKDCGRTFSSISHFKRHAELHDGLHIPGKNYFKCRECSYAFSYRRALLEHENTHRCGKRYQCRKCSYRTNRRDEFMEHKRKLNCSPDLESTWSKSSEESSDSTMDDDPTIPSRADDDKEDDDSDSPKGEDKDNDIDRDGDGDELESQSANPNRIDSGIVGASGRSEGSRLSVEPVVQNRPRTSPYVSVIRAGTSGPDGGVPYRADNCSMELLRPKTEPIDL